MVCVTDISRTFTNKVQSDNVNSARKSGSHSSDDSSLERVRPSAKSNRYDSSLTADLRDMKHRMDRAVSCLCTQTSKY